MPPGTLLENAMSTQKNVRRQFGSVEESSLRIDTDKAEQIIDALNTDLANSYVLYHQLKKHHWNVEGAEFLPVHKFQEECYQHLEEGADKIAERAQALGGVPVSGMRSLADTATVEPEDDDVYDIRTSMENDLEMYGDVIEGLREHIKLANNLGDYATEQLLTEILAVVEEDAHHHEHYLADDSLAVEGAVHEE